MSCMRSKSHFSGKSLLEEKKTPKPLPHFLLSYDSCPSSHLPPFFTSLLSALCWVCVFSFASTKSTVFLSLGSVSMSLHLICIRFSTLSGSYLIPTQYAAEGNWVLRPSREREVFWRLFKFITVFCWGLDGAWLAARGHRGVRYGNRERGES